MHTPETTLLHRKGTNLYRLEVRLENQTEARYLRQPEVEALAPRLVRSLETPRLVLYRTRPAA